MFYSLVSNEGQSSITVYNPGDPTSYVANDDHPNFRKIVESVIADDTDLGVLDLFDVSRTIQARLERLTERVSVADGRVYFDGDPIDNSIAEQILRFVRAGADDWLPLAKFMENVAANPQEHSRTQLYDWLSRREFTITPEGNIVGYKGVMLDDEHGFVSISCGPAVVDGVPVNGHVPNRIGATVEIARSAVHHDPSVGCSTGLHVGSWDYAHSFARGAVLEVHVNPRDVVSVPTDCDWAKVRCCRYVVVNIIEVPYTAPIVGEGYDDLYDEDDFEPDYDEWFDEDDDLEDEPSAKDIEVADDTHTFGRGPSEPPTPDPASPYGAPAPRGGIVGRLFGR